MFTVDIAADMDITPPTAPKPKKGQQITSGSWKLEKKPAIENGGRFDIENG